MRVSFGLFTCLFWIALGQSRTTMVAQEHEHPVPEKLGTVKFPTSCSADVQQEFERAVALLHSFAYSVAEKSFRAVLTKDPNCAMAHWGVAMTYFHQLWDPYLTADEAVRGQIEIDQAKGLGDSDRERGFIEALKIIYTNADSVPYADRASGYVLAMGELAHANP